MSKMGQAFMAINMDDMKVIDQDISSADMADAVASTLPRASLIRALIRQGVVPTEYRIEYEHRMHRVLTEMANEEIAKAGTVIHPTEHDRDIFRD